MFDESNDSVINVHNYRVKIDTLQTAVLQLEPWMKEEKVKEILFTAWKAAFPNRKTIPLDVERLKSLINCPSRFSDLLKSMFEETSIWYISSLIYYIAGDIYPDDLGYRKKLLDIFYLKVSVEKKVRAFEETLKRICCNAYDKVGPSQAREAFNSEYNGSDHIVGHFIKFEENEVLGAYRMNGYLYDANYFSVIQSCGWGKTRMLLEAGCTAFNLVYGCLNASNQGYPPHNPNLRSFLAAEHTMEEMAVFICATYKIALINAQEFYNDAECKVSEMDTFHHFYEMGTMIDGRKMDVLFPTFWFDVLAEVTLCKMDKTLQRRNGLINELQEAEVISADLKGRGKGKVIKLEDGRFVLTELMLVLDETRSLISTQNTISNEIAEKNLCLLREALRVLDCRFFSIIFVDTAQKVPSFTPPQVGPTSCQDKGHQLFPVYYEVQAYDCDLWKGGKLRSGKLAYDSMGNWDLSITGVGDILRRFSRGRPLWIRTIECFGAADVIKVGKIVKYAKQKLTCLTCPTIRSASGNIICKDIVAALACLSIRFGVVGIFDQDLVNAMVARHMGTLMYVDEHRARMMVRYSVEPVLSEAACQLIHYQEFNPDALVTFIKAVARYCVSGIVDAGDLDKLTGRIIVCLTFDIIRMQRKDLGYLPVFTGEVTIEEFMDCFFSEEFCTEYSSKFKEAGKVRKTVSKLPAKRTRKCEKVQPFTIPSELKNATTVITSVAYVENIPTDEQNYQIFLRQSNHLGVAIMLPSDHQVNLIIPWKTTSQYKDGGPLMGATYFRFNSNIERSVNTIISDAGKTLDPSNWFRGDYGCTPYMAILFELQGKDFLKCDFTAEEYQELRAFHEEYPNHAVISGLKPFKALNDDELRNVLGALCRARDDPIDVDGHYEELVGMDPLTYINVNNVPRCTCGSRWDKPYHHFSRSKFCTESCRCKKNGRSCNSQCYCKSRLF